MGQFLGRPRHPLSGRVQRLLLESVDVAVGYIKSAIMRQILRHEQDINFGAELLRKALDPGNQGVKVRSKINGKKNFFNLFHRLSLPSAFLLVVCEI